MSATDEDIFASAMNDTPEATGEQTVNTPESPIEAPTEAKPDRARDDQGRFTSKPTEAPTAPAPVVQETAPQPVAEAAPKADANVPSWRLAEESQRRREAEQALNDMRAEFRQMQMQMAQAQRPQAQPEPIDPFADPNGFAQNIHQTFEQKLQQLQLQHSLQFARFAHKDVFDKAYESFIDYVHRTRDQASYQRVMSSADPGEALVQWHREQELHRELGGSDLKSFLDKQKEEWLKDPATQAKVIEAFKATQQQAQPNNITNIPPSLSRVASASPMHDGGVDTSQEGIFRYAMKR